MDPIESMAGAFRLPPLRLQLALLWRSTLCRLLGHPWEEEEGRAAWSADLGYTLISRARRWCPRCGRSETRSPWSGEWEPGGSGLGPPEDL